MKLESKPALQATLLLVLVMGVIAVMALLPWWVNLPISIGVLWGLFYIALRELHRLKKPGG